MILSGQMGVVPWEVLQGHQGHVRFLDRYGLSSRDFTACAITEAAPRSAVGLLVPLGFFFHNLDALERERGVPPPDVIVDLGRSLDPDLMRSQGYTVVYRQEGPVRSTSRWFPGRTFTADEFVAVRSALHDGSFPLRVRRFGPWEPLASVHSTGSRP